jgi:predicted RNA-binding Zn ribbon-like protein
VLSGGSLEFAAAADFDDPTALGRIFVLLGALSTEPQLRPDDFSAATLLRQAIARCALAAAGNGALPERDVATLNSFAGDDPPVPILRADRSCVRAATDPARAALAAIARDAIETLASPARRLRTCEACGRVFEDRSRAGKRRWCSMARCGNRSKLAAFRRRRQR